VQIGEVFYSIKQFLFSKANKEVIVFLFFLMLSCIFWLMATLNRTYETEVRFPVKYTNVSRNTVFTSGDTDTLLVTVSDKGFNLLTYMFDEGKRTIAVDYRQYARNGQGTINTSELQRFIESKILSSTHIVVVKPEQLTFYFTENKPKRVPVRYQGNVKPEQLYFIAGTDYDPDSVTVYASEAMLSQIKYVYTEPLNLSDFRDTLTVTCRLEHKRGVKVVPEEVTVSFRTDVLSEVSIEGVPVVGRNMPADKLLRTFPSKVTISFVASRSTFNALKPSDFKVYADYNDIADNPSPKCRLRLGDLPLGVSNAKLSVETVDYLIEER